MPKIYGAMLSPFVRKVLLMLEAKGVSYENEMVLPGMQPAGYEKISPLGKIPALEDGDFCLADSTVINEYLEERHPEPAMFPGDIQLRAKARWFEEYADTVLTDTLITPFFQRLVVPMRGETPDEAAIAKAESETIPAILDQLETLLPGAEFLFEQRLSNADIALVSPFINAELGGYTVDAGRWPNTAAYVAFVREHQVFKAREAQEQEFIKALSGG